MSGPRVVAVGRGRLEAAFEGRHLVKHVERINAPRNDFSTTGDEIAGNHAPTRPAPGGHPAVGESKLHDLGGIQGEQQTIGRDDATTAGLSADVEPRSPPRPLASFERERLHGPRPDDDHPAVHDSDNVETPVDGVRPGGRTLAEVEADEPVTVGRRQQHAALGDHRRGFPKPQRPGAFAVARQTAAKRAATTGRSVITRLRAVAVRPGE